MSNERAARLGVILAMIWLVVLGATNVVLPPSVVPDPLFPLAPLIAAAVCSTRTTAGVAAAAVALTVVSGLYNENWDTVQQWVRLLGVVLISVAAAVIAEVRTRRERRFDRVSAIAEVAQRVILPVLPSAAGGVRATARYWSSAEDALVGGDLYDCSLTGGHVRFLIGDMRGKGIEAIEQAARVIRAFRQSAAIQPELDGVARDMDAYLAPFFGDEDFVTALLVDATDADRLVVTCCGHPPPLLIRADGSAELLEVPAGLPLGLGGAPGSVALTWGPGDRLLLYTDGVSEARGQDREFLAPLDLAPVLVAATLDEALEGFLARVRAHVPGGKLLDDAAVVLLENAGGLTTPAARTKRPAVSERLS